MYPPSEQINYQNLYEVALEQIAQQKEEIKELEDKIVVEEKIKIFKAGDPREVIFTNWYKYEKSTWVKDIISALEDIKYCDGDNLVDILEDYYEPLMTKVIVNDNKV